MSKGKLRLLDETVEYFDYGDYVRAVIYRTDPDTGEKEKVEEFALTPHAILTSLFGKNGKVAAANRLMARLGIGMHDTEIVMSQKDALAWLVAITDAITDSEDDIVTIKRSYSPKNHQAASRSMR